LLSDGETNEGTTWESAHFAVIKELENLIVIIDNNGLQGFGRTGEVLGETASLEKFNQIGFAVYECDGHNIQDLLSIIEKAEKSKNKKPILIVANTIKGKGVSFMENKLEWHYLNLDETLLEESMNEVQNYIF
jgi:transketolase